MYLRNATGILLFFFKINYFLTSNRQKTTFYYIYTCYDSNGPESGDACDPYLEQEQKNSGGAVMDKMDELRTQIEKERTYLDELVSEGAGQEKVAEQSCLVDRLIDQYYGR